jgi:hypothetical protein
MSETETATSPALAVLYERIDRVLDDYQELRSMVAAQAETLSQIKSIQKDIGILNSNTNKLYEELKSTMNLTSEHSVLLRSHSTIWKICGAFLLACTGIIGFSITTIQNLQSIDNAADRRILQLEYQIKTLNERAKP